MRFLSAHGRSFVCKWGGWGVYVTKENASKQKKDNENLNVDFQCYTFPLTSEMSERIRRILFITFPKSTVTSPGISTPNSAEF